MKIYKLFVAMSLMFLISGCPAHYKNIKDQGLAFQVYEIMYSSLKKGDPKCDTRAMMVFGANKEGYVEIRGFRELGYTESEIEERLRDTYFVYEGIHLSEMLAMPAKPKFRKFVLRNGVSHLQWRYEHCNADDERYADVFIKDSLVVSIYTKIWLY
jgi:hypothetical protein